jgi:hypothetical protein
MYVRHKRCAGLRYAILLAAVALLITACGSSSSAPSPMTPVGKSAAHRDVVSSGAITQRPVRGTGGNEINDENAARAGSGNGRPIGQNPSRADSGNGRPIGQNPCMVVSKAEAQAIINRPIAAPQEAPLGPTCIYQPLGNKTLITLAVESIDFAKVRPHIRHVIRVVIAGRTAYCGDYGRPTTFVPLANGRVLTVTAPCGVGTRFAKKALPLLKT